jgi:hypothetical protein
MAAAAAAKKAVPGDEVEEYIGHTLPQQQSDIYKVQSHGGRSET